VNKVYFGITREAGSYARIVGVVANTQLTGSRPATSEEIQTILDKVKANASDSLADSLRDGTYPNTISVWDKRVDARAAIANLQSYNSPHFSYSVGEFGDAERTVTKALGWRIELDYGEISSYNCQRLGASVFLDGNEKNTNIKNCLFSSRAAARRVIKDNGLVGYTVTRVDA
jgi:hypothetical protein